MGDSPAPRHGLTRLALASARLPDRVAHGLRAILNGVWLGLLADDRLRDLDETFYANEQLYSGDEWNEKGLFNWERERLSEHFRRGSRVVVAACGGGREVLALLEEGFDAVGFESNPELAASGRDFLAAHGHPDRIHRSERNVFPLQAGDCEGVILGWGVYSLISRRAGRVGLLVGARERLPDGGPVLLSFFEAPLTRELVWTSAIANALRRLRSAEPVELGDTLAPGPVHVFTREAIAEEIAAAGLELATYGLGASASGEIRYAHAVARAR